MKLTLHIFFTLFFIAFVSCKNNKKAENALTEGTIEFDCTVVDNTNPMAGFAPGKATINFKNNKFEIEMSVMGILKTSFLSNPSNKTLSQMLKYLDIKDACIETETEMLAQNKDYAIKFEETKETKMIAGYKCHKAKATMVNKPEVVFDVYYTTDLGGDSLNYLGPYRDIKGMLMQFRLKKLGLELSFTANTVTDMEIKDDVFEIPSYYKIITRKEMDGHFADLQN